MAEIDLNTAQTEVCLICQDLVLMMRREGPGVKCEAGSNPDLRPWSDV